MLAVARKIDTFEQLSRKAAADFLQTVVIVDDEALIMSRDDNSLVEKLATQEEHANANLSKDEHERLNAHLAETSAIPLSDAVATESASVLIGRKKRPIPIKSKGMNRQELANIPHILDARTLVDVFAHHGLVCSVLKPIPDSYESVLGNTLSVARRADIVIVDWVMLNRHGYYALKVMSDIISADGNSRMRLIVVYTGENAFVDIVKDIKTHMTETLGRDFKNEDLNTLLDGPVRILIIGKIHSTAPSSEVEKVSEAELPARVINEFSKMTMGLVPNVALGALTFIRTNTHNILTKLNEKLDSSYLSHRVLLPDPDDAQGHLIALIADELRGVLDEFALANAAGIEVIEAWLRHQKPDGSFVLEIGSSQVTITVEQLVDLLEVGIDKWNVPVPQNSNTQKNTNEKFQRHGFKTLTSMFSGDAIAARESDHAFAMLTALESDYKFEEPFQVLTMGSIICNKIVEDGKPVTVYWLCVQPLCDSVRLDKPRFFPLLPFKRIDLAANPEARFDIVVRDQDKTHVHLRLNHKPHECRMVEFAPKGRCIRTVNDTEGNLVFETADVTYRWVANLKVRQAQRVLNNYASSALRVGLDESEWLRRSAGKPGD